MSQSATAPRRSERMAATASRLTTVSRRLTAQRGLSGFTIEEVCAEVGVSRRTFFNYFPSKDEAVLGIAEAEEERRLEERFQDRGSRGWPAVLDDLVELVAGHFAEQGFHTAEHVDFLAAMGREPKLLARAMGIGREREERLVALVAAREGVPATDLRARAVIDLFSALLRTGAEHLLRPDSDGDAARVLLDLLAAFREVAAPSTASPTAEPKDLR